MTDAYRAILEERNPDDPQGRTYAELVALAVVRQAAAGKIPAAIEIANRLEGKSIQTTALLGDEDEIKRVIICDL